MNQLIQKACDLVDGQTALADILTELSGEEISQQRVRNWIFRGDEVPIKFLPLIERATKGEITRKMLRPDDWQTIWPELAAEAAEEPFDGTERRTGERRSDKDRRGSDQSD